MQTSILIASTLKPIDDVRGFEKLAVGLNDVGKYKIHLAGPPPSGATDLSQFSVHEMKPKRQGFIRRFFIGWQLWPVLMKVKPELIIANSHDLLIVISLYRILFGGRLIYDIQENYYLNLLHQKSYARPIRFIAALYIRTVEIITSPMISHFILAEKSYLKELPFLRGRGIILENKVVKAFLPENVELTPEGTVFMYTGTISEDYGVYDAISWFKSLNQVGPDRRLIISGHCTKPETKTALLELCKDVQAISLDLHMSPLSHHKVLLNIARADFLLLPYKRNRSTENCIPAKLYESIALSTPVLISENDLWDQLLNDWDAGAAVNFEATNTSPEATDTILSRTYYQKMGEIGIYWSDEGQIFVDLVAKLLSK